MIIKLNNFVAKFYSTTGVSNLSSSSRSDNGTFCNILLSNIGAITVVTITIQIIIEIISPVIMSDSVVVATATNISPTSPLGDIPIPIKEVFNPLPIAPRADTYLPTKAKRLTNIPYQNTSREAKV